MDVLRGEQKNKDGVESQMKTVLSAGGTFSSLAPPLAAPCEICCSCLIRSLKSATHWITVIVAGTV